MCGEQAYQQGTRQMSGMHFSFICLTTALRDTLTFTTFFMW